MNNQLSNLTQRFRDFRNQIEKLSGREKQKMFKAIVDNFKMNVQSHFCVTTYNAQFESSEKHNQPQRWVALEWFVELRNTLLLI